MSLQDIWENEDLIPFLLVVGGLVLLVRLLIEVVYYFKEKTHNYEESARFQNVPPIAFNGDLAVADNGELTLTIFLENKTGKDIAAVQFYLVAQDVYQRDVAVKHPRMGVATPIAVGASKRLHCGIDNPMTNAVSVYLYSIYYTDQTEWGNKEAEETVIRENALRAYVVKTTAN